MTVWVLDEQHGVWHEIDTASRDRAALIAQDWKARGFQVRSEDYAPPAYLSTYQHQISNPATCTLDLI
ncbi:hypothetical protein [Streptomyces werraensis]|uniref:hypothetical protein n=1 Tax=Streptomyces werraensis TaxID=68284 RepID=UPI0036FCE56A